MASGRNSRTKNDRQRKDFGTTNIEKNDAINASKSVHKRTKKGRKLPSNVHPVEDKLTNFVTK